MPTLRTTTYTPPLLLRNGHLQTIYPSLFRRVGELEYIRERVETPDSDFLDLDWSRVGTRRLAILSHGLEGNSDRTYIRGMARAVNRAGWDALAWNYRGCGGEMNRTARLYHSGATEDLVIVIDHAVRSGGYDEIVLLGFSLGGNLTLKYIGERGDEIEPRISAAVVFSVPCDLKASADRLAVRSNRIYMRSFLTSLTDKIRRKMEQMPGSLADHGLDVMRTFHEFDNLYTAPMHGFADADDYWRKSSCRQFIPNIRVPATLISAKDDPFLPDACYPFDEARANPLFTLEVPEHGGHVGFVSFGGDGSYWSERRAVEILSER